MDVAIMIDTAETGGTIKDDSGVYPLQLELRSGDQIDRVDEHRGDPYRPNAPRNRSCSHGGRSWRRRWRSDPTAG